MRNGWCYVHIKVINRRAGLTLRICTFTPLDIYRQLYAKLLQYLFKLLYLRLHLILRPLILQTIVYNLDFIPLHSLETSQVDRSSQYPSLVIEPWNTLLLPHLLVDFESFDEDGNTAHGAEMMSLEGWGERIRCHFFRAVDGNLVGVWIA